MTTFGQHLRSKLLSDNYGNWRTLPEPLLESLCERVSREAEEFFIDRDLEAELDAAEEELSKLKEAGFPVNPLTLIRP